MCCDSIFINEHGNQYQVNLLDIDGKKTYMIFRKTPDESEFKTFYIPTAQRFDTEREAYTDAINNIKNDI